MADDASGAPVPPGRDMQQDTRIAHLRDSGLSWLEIQQQFGLTRQQARYAYQRGKREERRDARRHPSADSRPD